MHPHYPLITALMFFSAFYYRFKPFIPRRIQIALRRQIVRKKLPSCANVWPIDKRAATPPPGWRGWPDGKKFAFVITHDVETARGHERSYRLAKLDLELGFRSSFNFVPEGYKVSDVLRRELVKYGFEVGVHGLTHRAQLYTSKDKFSKKVDRGQALLEGMGCRGLSHAIHVSQSRLVPRSGAGV